MSTCSISPMMCPPQSCAHVVSFRFPQLNYRPHDAPTFPVNILRDHQFALSVIFRYVFKNSSIDPYQIRFGFFSSQLHHFSALYTPNYSVLMSNYLLVSTLLLSNCLCLGKARFTFKISQQPFVNCLID